MKSNCANCVTRLLILLLLGIFLTSSTVPTVLAYGESDAAKLTISPYITLTKKSTHQLTPTINGVSANLELLTFSSSNSKVARVDANGLVTAARKGSAYITISENLHPDNFCKIRVFVGKRASRLRLNCSRKTIYINRYFMLKASVPSGAALKKLSYTSSNPQVAQVSSKGKILGVSCGTATITVTTLDGSNLSRTCTITVKSSSEENEKDNHSDTFFPFKADTLSTKPASKHTGE